MAGTLKVDVPADFEELVHLELCKFDLQRYRARNVKPLKDPAENSTPGEMLKVPSDIAHMISSGKVQKVMPDLRPCLSPVKCRAFEGFTADRVKYELHGLGDELYQHIKLSQQWQQSCREGHNDLLWFVNRVNLEKPCTPSTAVRTTSKKVRGVNRLNEDNESVLDTETATFPINPLNPDGPRGPFRKRVTSVRFGALALFEDLFYILWYKIQVLYQDLRVRYANGFIKLTDVVHNRGTTLQKSENLTVHDFSAILRYFWDALTEPKLVHTLDKTLRQRFMLLNTKSDYSLESPNQLNKEAFRIQYLLRGQAQPKRGGGLLDISTAIPMAVINKVYQRNGIILDSEKAIEQQHNDLRGAERLKLSTQRYPVIAVNPKDYTCLCPWYCVCRDLCKTDPDGGCLCSMQPDFYDAYEIDMLADKNLQQAYETSVGEHYLFGAPSNEYSQALVARAALSMHADPIVQTNMFRRERDLAAQLKKLEWDYVCSTMVDYQSPTPISTPNSTPSLHCCLDLDKPLPDLPAEAKRKREASSASPSQEKKKMKCIV